MRESKSLVKKMCVENIMHGKGESFEAEKRDTNN